MLSKILIPVLSLFAVAAFADETLRVVPTLGSGLHVGQVISADVVGGTAPYYVVRTTPQDCGYLAINTEIHGGVFTAGKIPGACTVEVRDSSDPVQSATLTLYVQPLAGTLSIVPAQSYVYMNHTLQLNVTGGQGMVSLIDTNPQGCGTVDTQRWIFTPGNIAGTCSLILRDQGKPAQEAVVTISVKAIGT